MNLDRFIRERSASWTELQGLLAKASGQPSKLTPAEMRRAAALYRSVAADVGRARRQFPGDQQLRPLEQLVNEAHGLVYGSHRRGGTFGEFVRTRFWQIVREDRGALWLAIVLTFAPAIAAFIYAQVNPAGAANLVPSTFNTVVQQRSHGADIGLPLGIQPAIAAQIFTNNIQVAFLALAGGLTGGLLTAYMLLNNGMMLGVVFGLGFGGHQGSVTAQLLLPHGGLEMSCIVVAGTAGLRIARALVMPGRLPREAALSAIALRVGEMILGVAALLVVAGLIEGFVTPQGIGLFPALCLGLGLPAIFWTAVWRRGRPTRPRERGGLPGAEGLRAGLASSG